VHTKLWLKNPEGKGPLQRPMCRWEDVIWMSNIQAAKVWTGLIWLRIGTCDGCSADPSGSNKHWELLSR
jgi:hypothetical protein